MVCLITHWQTLGRGTKQSWLCVLMDMEAVDWESSFDLKWSCNIWIWGGKMWPNRQVQIKLIDIYHIKICNRLNVWLNEGLLGYIKTKLTIFKQCGKLSKCLKMRTQCHVMVIRRSWSNTDTDASFCMFTLVEYPGGCFLIWIFVNSTTVILLGSRSDLNMQCR